MPTSRRRRNFFWQTKGYKERVKELEKEKHHNKREEHENKVWAWGLPSKNEQGLYQARACLRFLDRSEMIRRLKTDSAIST